MCRKLSNKVCVPKKTEDLNLSVFNMITGINELKTLIKHVNPNVSLLVESVIQIKKGITISIVASVKIQNNVVCV